MTKDEVLKYLRSIELITICTVFFSFPIFFLTSTLDTFIFPKQILILVATLFLLLSFSVRSLIEGQITIKSTPFNLPLLLLALSVLISSVLSRNFYDSLISSIPFIMLFIFYFVIINSIEDKSSLKAVIFSLLVGSMLSVIISILSNFKIYLLPFQETHNPLFNTFGSPVQHILYLLPIFLLSLQNIFQKLKKDISNFVIFSITFFVSGLGIVFFLYQFISSPNKPPLLPHNYGFQIALSSISQDSTRLVQSFLFGTGYGTFSTDFTRFKIISYNQEPTLWNIVFSFSSTFALELLSTVGIMGLSSFIFLFVRFIKTKSQKNGIYIMAFTLFLLSFLLPFSYSLLFLFIVSLALCAVSLYIDNYPSVYNLSFSFVALKHGLFGFIHDEKASSNIRTRHRVLPFLFLLFNASLTFSIGFYAFKLLSSDIKFRNSLISSRLGDAKTSYNLERRAITEFPYRSDYYRVFSQLNLMLATSLLSQVPKDSTPSAQVQKTALTLLQQSIDSGRSSVALAPLTSQNWLNLSKIYRNLINVGQNADQFALASLSQAISLDPNNPQLYIELGGIYYQLGQYEASQNQFTIAVKLKSDLANAHYNLGHALEAKGDLKNAMGRYLAVKKLVEDNSPDNLKKINDEISSLQEKMGNLTGVSSPQNDDIDLQNIKTEQPSLQLSSPSAQLPASKPPISIAPPPNATGSAK